jgi:hypothetical protein
MAVFFCGTAHAADTPVVAELLRDSLVIVPVWSTVGTLTGQLPPQLCHINALAVGDKAADQWARLTSFVLETFRLLRRERRLFISYKRADSQSLANQLYDEFDKRGFDVFIDIRSVPPAADFQSVLWHRMSDSDIVVLIDTPGFRTSRWTTAELAQANATNVQILHLLWPGQSEDSASAFSHFFELELSSFEDGDPAAGKGVIGSTIDAICERAEVLRAQAIAARHRHLLDNFCDAARDVGLSPVVQPSRWIAVRSKKGKDVVVVPAIGVPTSDRINQIFDDAQSAKNVWAIYDDRGILSDWQRHLNWLGAHLPVRIFQMSQVATAMAELLK